MAYRLEVNLSFGFRNSLVNTFLQVFNNASLNVNVLTVAESAQDLTQDALTECNYGMRLQCIFIIFTAPAALIRGRCFSTPCAALN